MKYTKLTCKEPLGPGESHHHFYYSGQWTSGFPLLQAQRKAPDKEGQHSENKDEIDDFDYEYLHCDQNPSHLHKYYGFELKGKSEPKNI